MFRPAVAIIRFYESKNALRWCYTCYNLCNGVLMKISHHQYSVLWVLL